jgi:S-adenosylmethionine:tRNA-ribosyltransferase-isomerase (queuine synthetase)
LLLFTGGAIKLVRDLIVFNFHVPTSTVLILLTAVQVGAMGLLADLIVKRSVEH